MESWEDLKETRCWVSSTVEERFICKSDMVILKKLYYPHYKCGSYNYIWTKCFYLEISNSQTIGPIWPNFKKPTFKDQHNFSVSALGLLTHSKVLRILVDASGLFRWFSDINRSGSVKYLIYTVPGMNSKGLLYPWMHLRLLTHSDGLGSWPLRQRSLRTLSGRIKQKWEGGKIIWAEPRIYTPTHSYTCYGAVEMWIRSIYSGHMTKHSQG